LILLKTVILISSIEDHQLHLVYEGRIAGDNEKSNIFFKKIWERIISKEIHIYFYSQSNPNYCRKLDRQSNYLHYEGNLDSGELVKEMTHYDCGLNLFQVPVVVCDVGTHKAFVNKYHVGGYLDLEGNIVKQLNKIAQIRIDKDFLKNSGFTMKSKQGQLPIFMKK